jgi:predicted ATPase
MEQMATPGSILMTEYTRKLVAGYFELKALGAAEIKGVEVPLSVYEVLGAGPLRTRLQVATRRGLTRFVGRQSELEQLGCAWNEAQGGHGQIVGVMGEPGLGKSRLFYEFKLLSQSGCLILEAYSVSYGKASPYLPLIELLKSYFQLQPHDDARTRRQKVIGKVLELDRNLEDTLPYLYALLGVEEQPSPLQQMDPQIRRKRTFAALKQLFLRESLNQPLILIFEDLHWIDAETQGFLDIFSESVASARLLLLTNYRPEYRHEWGQKTYYTQLRLAPFGKAEAEEFLDALLGMSVGADRRVGPQGLGAHAGASLHVLKRLILEKTEGTPFFIEEVVQTLAEEEILAGDRGNYRVEKVPTELHISPTVHGVLAARIDRLAVEEKALLQQLAVIGREFPVSLIRQVITQPEDELYRLLASLQRKEFLYERPAFPEVEYIFKHALTQEVAYGTVLQERRKALHEQTARVIEALNRATLDEHYSELAHHYTRSGNTEKAVEYLHLAGQQAVQRSANEEAINHLTTALELLQTLPDTPERIQRELTLHLTLGPPLLATKGYAASEVEHTYTRALELCRQEGKPTQLFPALGGLWQFYCVRAEYQKGREIGEQLLTLAQTVQDPALLLVAHDALGQTFHWLGEFVLAREYLQQSIARYDPQQHRSLAFLLGGEDPGVACRSFVASTLWCLGHPDQALHRQREALTLAHELSHPFSLAVALGATAVLHQLRREGQAAQERAEAAVALCTEQEIRYWGAIGAIQCGWARAEQGQIEEGITQIRQGLIAYQATGAELWLPYFLALLAETHGKVGQAEEGLTALAEALTVVDKTGERMYEAELYRLKGMLTLQSQASLGQVQDQSAVINLRPLTSDPHGEAEACFQKAIEIARRQQAKSLELRAAMSLSRLWQKQGKRDEARQMLAEIYGWFTEGFDTKDLQEAKALIEELNIESSSR